MNTLHETFERQAGNAGAPDFDIAALVGLGEQRLRRHRLAVVAGAGTAVALAIAVAVGGTAWNRSAEQSPGPIDHRPQTEIATPNTTRPLVYSDVSFVLGKPDSLLGDPIHVGDRVAETGSGFVHMAVTDDGVVYATGGYRDDGRMWFTDGGTPVQIASHACPSAHGWPGSIITGNSGSLAAWLDCTRNDHPELVVFDTSSGHEVVTPQLRGCTDLSSDDQVSGSGCHPVAIIGDLVYLARDEAGLLPDGGAASGSIARDIRNNPRGLVVGDTWATGTPTLSGRFTTVGRRLVPTGADGRLTTAFDTATRRPVDLHLPAGYEPDPPEPGNDFGLFQWLDDDTVALENYRTGRHDQDILTCRLSTGRCELAVPGRGRDHYYRVVQNENLGNVEFQIGPEHRS